MDTDFCFLRSRFLRTTSHRLSTHSLIHLPHDHTNNFDLFTPYRLLGPLYPLFHTVPLAGWLRAWQVLLHNPLWSWFANLSLTRTEWVEELQACAKSTRGSCKYICLVRDRISLSCAGQNFNDYGTMRTDFLRRTHFVCFQRKNRISASTILLGRFVL